MAQVVSSFTLIDAAADEDITDIRPGEQYILKEMGVSTLNIRANVSSSEVGSVVFYVNGQKVRTESQAPFALAGDNKGDYYAWSFTLGKQLVRAELYSDAGGKGTLLSSRSIDFEIHKLPPITEEEVSYTELYTTRLILVDATTKLDIRDLEEQDTVNLQKHRNITIRAEANVFPGSMRFSVNDKTNFRTEGIQPYVMTRDEGDYYRTWTTATGSYQISATPYTGEQRTGKEGDSKTINLVVIDEEIAEDADDLYITKMILVDADSKADIRELKASDTINLRAHPKITIRAEANLSVGSIRFDVDDKVNYRTEGIAPYVLTRDEGSYYEPWTDQTGKYTVVAVPFTGEQRTGVQGVSKAVDLVLVNEEIKEEEQPANLAVTKLILVNAATKQDIRVLNAKDTVDVKEYPDITVRAETNIEPGSIRFDVDEQVNFRTEGIAPYVMTGEQPDRYVSWEAELGDHRITAVPFTGEQRTGQQGTAKQVDLVLISGSNDTTAPPPSGGTDENISGEMRKWHPVTITFSGPQTSESDQVNPFTDYRLQVTFTHTSSGKTYSVPGFYAADGNAENTSADKGNKWRVIFAPDRTGEWKYKVSFRKGTDVAISLSATAGSPTHFDGQQGTFNIAASNKPKSDFRNKGRLEYVGEHYLQFADSKEWFIKAGSDAPENTLAYDDFDATPNKNNRRKSWKAHAQDFNKSIAGDYTWGPMKSDGARDKGRELLGAITYLKEQGMNVFSFLTYSLDGDDGNVYPHRAKVSNAIRWNDVHHDRFDVSKMAQWDNLFLLADKLGMYIHFKLQETENDQKMDAGKLGRERKIYYREMIARYGYHLALNWNLGEENDIWTELNDPDNINVKNYAKYVRDVDPYNHHVVIHTYPWQQDKVYPSLLGNASQLTGASVQTDAENVHDHVLKWVRQSNSNGKKWVVANDEQGSADHGVGVDSSYPSSDLPENMEKGDNRKLVRHEVLWGSLLAGGAGVEYYFGYKTGCDDLDCEDYSTRELKWKDAKIAVDFFNTYLQDHLIGMKGDDGLSSSSSDFVFAKKGKLYVIYLPNGGSTNLNLSGVSGNYNVEWFNPRSGGDLQRGNVGSVAGGGQVSLGEAPKERSQDWVILVRNEDISSPIAVVPPSDGGTAECGDFVENNGLVVAEVESVPKTSSNWYKGSGSVNGLNVPQPSGSYYMWKANCSSHCEKVDQFKEENTITYTVYINNPGRYRFKARTWQPNIEYPGEAPHTANNDFWVKLPDTGGKIIKNGTVYPFSKDTPEKLFQSNVNGWRWETKAESPDGSAQLFVDFPAKGTYRIQIAGRSKYFAIDRFVLYRDDVADSYATNMSRSESSRTTCNTMNDSDLEEFASATTTINAYPNPFTDSFRLNVKDGVQSVRIFDLSGKVVYEDTRVDTRGGQLEIRLSSRPAGIYQVIIETDKGPQMVRVLKR